MRLFPGILFNVLVGIFDHHDGPINHGADSDGNTAQTHDVGVDALSFHYNKTDEDPNRQGENRHKGTAQVK